MLIGANHPALPMIETTAVEVEPEPAAVQPGNPKLDPSVKF
jgi:hypothetical protein